ncbi:MAG: helix-turn-helix domain-containing protein [Thermoplasmata archaeon]|nr:MAG: helix-turn-helix domain-containing protein [Thermoplasmata archaeon]
MRKMVLEVEPGEEVLESLGPILESLSSYQVLEQLKFDREKGTCVDLIECRLREGLSIDEVDWFGHMELLSVIKTEGKDHTCLVKYYQPQGGESADDDFEFDLVYTTPNLISRERFVVSAIGDDMDLARFMDGVRKHVGKVVKMSMSRAAYQRRDILTVLTDRQREVLTAANQYGYYDYPRGVSSEKLADRVGISKPVLLQHLRKAEKRIMADIFAGL